MTGSAVDAAAANRSSSTLIIGLVQRLLGMLGLSFSFILLPLFLHYLLNDQPKMSTDFYRNVPLPWKADVERILPTMTRNIAHSFNAELLVGSIMFVVVSVGMMVIGGLVPGGEILVAFALLLSAAPAGECRLAGECRGGTSHGVNAGRCGERLPVVVAPFPGPGTTNHRRM